MNNKVDIKKVKFIKCPECSLGMWVSEKKRKMRDKFPDIKAWCASCVIFHIKKQYGNDPNFDWDNDVEIIDLAII